MAEIDVIFQQYFMDYVLKIIYAGIILYLGKSQYPKFKTWIIWQQLHESERCYAERTRYQRQNLLQPLHRLISVDTFLRNKGIIRVVDIGVMTGINLRYFPNSTEVTAVDTRYNLDYFFNPMMKVRAFDHVRIKECVEYDHQDLKNIPDDFADAVVGSFVLCKAKNEAILLKEIHRILSPGGHYYFFEHCIDKEDHSLRRWQTVLSVTGIWPRLFDGCHLNRDIESSITNSPFSRVHCYKYNFNFAHPFALKYVKAHVLGFALK